MNARNDDQKQDQRQTQQDDGKLVHADDTNDREARTIGQNEDGTAYTNEDNVWPAGTVGPHGKPARESERGAESAGLLD